MIAFQEDSMGIVNDWMESLAPASSDFPSGARQSSNNDPLHLVSTMNELKSGLGYKISKKDDKTKVDHISKMVEKQQKAAKRKQEQALINDQRDLHGIIEDDVEESKTALVYNKKKSDANNKTINVKPNGVNNKETKSKSDSANSSNKNTTTTPITEMKADKTIESIFAIGSTSETTSFGENEGYTEQPYKKRKKTRSKQKNIRRDNRPDTAKPEYLQLGSQEYRGRQLTDETRAVLGVEKKPSKHNKKHNNQHNNKNNNNSNPTNQHKNSHSSSQSKGTGNQSSEEPVQKKQKANE